MSRARVAAVAALLLALAVPFSLAMGFLASTPLPVEKQGAGLDHCSPPFVRENPRADPGAKKICEPYENRRAALLIAIPAVPALVLMGIGLRAVRAQGRPAG